jgi:hypothetical protein
MPVIIMTVYVHPETGELRDSVESRLENRTAIEPPRQDALNIAVRELLEQADYTPLWGRTLEQQAEFTAKIKPLVDAMLASGDLSAITYDGEVDYSIIAEATYVFGLPGAKDVSEEVAASVTIDAIQETFGIPEDTIELYTRTMTFFDITEPEKPLWKFSFTPRSVDDWENGFDNPQYRKSYRVRLDALTGEVIAIEEFATLEAYDWKTLEGALKPYK